MGDERIEDAGVCRLEYSDEREERFVEADWFAPVTIDDGLEEERGDFLVCDACDNSWRVGESPLHYSDCPIAARAVEIALLTHAYKCGWCGDIFLKEDHRAHYDACPKHPAREVEDEVARLRQQVETLTERLATATRILERLSNDDDSLERLSEIRVYECGEKYLQPAVRAFLAAAALSTETEGEP